MIRRMVLLSALACAVMGCAAPTPTAVPTDVPPTATAEPTAEPTAATMTTGRYRELALVQVQRWYAAQQKITAHTVSGDWKTDDAARQDVIDAMKEAIIVSKNFEATKDVPAEAIDVHGRLVLATGNYARAMTVFADVIDLTMAGNVAGAAAKNRDVAALLNAASVTIADDIGALKALPSTP